jgi:hypothetical protein
VRSTVGPPFHWFALVGTPQAQEDEYRKRQKDDGVDVEIQHTQSKMKSQLCSKFLVWMHDYPKSLPLVGIMHQGS